MDQILKQITDLLSGIWDSPVVQLGLRAIAIYVVILWLAAAYWAFRDMQLRTSNPILPYFAASLVIVFTPVFFPFAIVAYRIVRPQEKIGEVYERTLAEEALLAEVEAVRSCPTCARRVDEEWIICPTCRTRLNRVCPNCSRLVGLDWSLCAWCGRDFERAAPAAEALPAPVSRAPVYTEPAFSPSGATPAIEATTYRGPVASVAPASRDMAIRDVAPPSFVQRDAPSRRDSSSDDAGELEFAREVASSSREFAARDLSGRDRPGRSPERSVDHAWPLPPPAIDLDALASRAQTMPPPAIVVAPTGPLPPPARSNQARPTRQVPPRSGAKPAVKPVPPSTDPLAEH